MIKSKNNEKKKKEKQKNKQHRKTNPVNNKKETYAHSESKETSTSRTLVSSFLATSPQYNFAIDMDRAYDTLFWSWDSLWTDELERAVIQLVLSVEDDLKKVTAQFGSMLSVFAMGANSMDDLMNMVQEDLSSAMEKHDLHSICRLHQTLYQFLELSMLYPFPPMLIQSISNYEKAKGQHSIANSLPRAISNLSKSTEEYVRYLVYEKKLAPNDNYLTNLNTTKQCCDTVMSTVFKEFKTNNDTSSTVNVIGSSNDLSPLWKIRNSQRLAHMMNSGFGTKSESDSFKVNFWPVLPLEVVLEKGDKLKQLLDRYTETLTGEVLMVGSMFNYRLGTDLEKNIKVIKGLLFSGCGYVASLEGTFVALHGADRAYLSLGKGTIKHSALFKRRKDVARMLRNSSRPLGNLSLRINTNFDLVVKKLREHHKESWIVPELEKTWRLMHTRLEIIMFEIWYGDNLIAADIGHPVEGGSFYVATRFFDRKFKKLQPGFLLALVETRILRSVFGLKMWDLGGTNGNPQMAYKAIVSTIQNRAAFLKEFRQLQKNNVDFKPIFKKGVILSNITEHHLLQVEK